MDVLAVTLAFLVGWLVREKRCDCVECECNQIEGHIWRACRDGEPLEENGICVRCGLYASEGDQPCDDTEPE